MNMDLVSQKTEKKRWYCPNRCDIDHVIVRMWVDGLLEGENDLDSWGLPYLDDLECIKTDDIFDVNFICPECGQVFEEERDYR